MDKGILSKPIYKNYVEDIFFTLKHITDICLHGAYALRKIKTKSPIEGANDLASEKELSIFVINISRDLLRSMPCHELRDAEMREIEEMYDLRLARLEQEIRRK
ncbi:MAG: hypothetical protein GYA34_11980 [Chloroflexi bacterium]|nr:hypothetical protein [Chloroflexota bacterium]